MYSVVFIGAILFEVCSSFCCTFDRCTQYSRRGQHLLYLCQSVGTGHVLDTPFYIPYALKLLTWDGVAGATNFVVDCHFQSVVHHVPLPAWASEKALQTFPTIDHMRRNMLVSQMLRGFQSRSRQRLKDPNLDLTTESAIITAIERSSDQLVGLVEIYPEEEVYLCNLAVARSERRKGIGRLLCKACERVAAEAWGRSSIGLNVDRRNAAAITLYESLGYVANAERGRPAAWEDLLLGNTNLLSYSKHLVPYR